MPWSIVTVLVLLVSSIVRPTQATCPKDTWYIQLRSDRGPGVFECRERVPPSPHEARGHEVEAPVVGYAGVVAGQIYCTGGQETISNGDGLSIACQARH